MIPDYIALPLLDRATLVDDEGLQEKWASLLASAVHPQTASSIWHLIPIMLANLSPRQARFLDIIFDYSYRNISIKIRPIAASAIAAHSQVNVEKLVNVVGISSFAWESNEERASALDNLVIQGIIKRNQSIAPDSYKALAGKIFAEGKLKTPYHCPDDHMVHMEDSFELTIIGTEFIMTCRPLNQRPWIAP